MSQRRVFFLILLVFGALLSGCSAPDPNPEKRDPLVALFEAKAKDAAAQLETAKSAAEEAKGKMEMVVPQTGQIKYARKHYYEALAQVEKASQLKKYYELKMKSQILKAQESYLDMYNKGTPDKWPDPKELEEFQQSEANHAKSRQWSVKRRIEEEKGAGAPPPPKSGGH